MTLNEMLHQLKAEHAALSNAIAHLEHYKSKVTGRQEDVANSTSWTCSKCNRLGNIGDHCISCGRSCRGRKSMSPEECKVVSERMRNYWGARRSAV